MLYENKESPNFKQDTVKLTRNISMVLLLTIAMLTVLSPEIIFLLNAENFSHAVYIINFVFLFNYFKIMVRIRGYLPYINNKTYMLTIAQIFSFVFALAFIFIFKNSFGIVGLAIFLLLPYFINYIFLTFYTEMNEKIKFHNYKEIVLFITILFLGYFHSHIDSIYVRALIFTGLLIYSLKYFNFITIIKSLYAKR
jgi:O-antigen/teichoic acid export membrane protein